MSEVITPPSGEEGLVVIIAALLGAIAWNLTTWYFGLPSSSSHALIGGLVGAAHRARAATVDWSAINDKVLIPMVLSPVVGFIVAFLVMLAILWIFRRRNPSKVNRGFKVAQTGSAAAMALGHGLQDAQKTMGVIFLALLTAGMVSRWRSTAHLGDRRGRNARCRSAPTPVAGGSCAPSVGASSTSTHREDSPQRSTAASILYITAFVYHAPISTTQIITSSIMGAGATKSLRAVRWSVGGQIAVAWVLTFPMAGLAAAVIFEILHTFLP